jgi:hypothetical protein
VTEWLASTLLAVPIAPDAQQQQQQQQHVGSPVMLREALLSPAALMSAGNSPGPGPGFIEQPVLTVGSAEAAEMPEPPDMVQQQQQQQQQLEEDEQSGTGALQEPATANAELCGGSGVRGGSCLRTLSTANCEAGTILLA